jgi:plastocyanin
MIAFPDGRAEYDGTGTVNSGLDVLRTADTPPYMLTFTAPGTYEYFCTVHSLVMKATVTVQEAGSELPNDAAAYEAMAQEQFAALVEEGRATIAELEGREATPAADGANVWDVAAGAGGMSQARVMKFIPEVVTIKAGDTVRWTNLAIGEPHTVTFLGGAEQPEDVMIEPQEGGVPKLIQNYQSLLPAGDNVFDGAGYTNSGFLGLPPEITEPLGMYSDVYELSFTVPGEYPYYCILHASGPEAETGMIGKVIVTE